MSDDYGNDFITLIDENGDEAEYELLDTLELNDNMYFALVKADLNEDDVLEEEDLLIVLKLIIDENGDEILATIEDDDEYEEVLGLFEENLADYYELEDHYDIEH
ncbi:MAG: DUF1292 domain-containing protein [Clostridia bacterium]|nr:DUF1292 domain-containing protein [Clostridia bacterium]